MPWAWHQGCSPVCDSVSKKGIEMAAQIITIDRRQHPRDGIIGKLEDIAYAALRKCAANIAKPNREAKSA
jgi:hypothetical protein